MLAPPAGYIPRHYRGTPLKTLYLQLQNRGRCRRDAYMVVYLLYAVAVTVVILRSILQ